MLQHDPACTLRSNLKQNVTIMSPALGCDKQFLNDYHRSNPERLVAADLTELPVLPRAELPQLCLQHFDFTGNMEADAPAGELRRLPDGPAAAAVPAVIVAGAGALGADAPPAAQGGA